MSKIAVGTVFLVVALIGSTVGLPVEAVAEEDAMPAQRDETSMVITDPVVMDEIAEEYDESVDAQGGIFDEGYAGYSEEDVGYEETYSEEVYDEEPVPLEEAYDSAAFDAADESYGDY